MKITLAGEGAGASSIDILMSASPIKPPFRAAILQSGDATSLRANTTGTGQSPFSILAGALGCQGDVLACVRSAPLEKIKDIVETQNLAFRPVVDDTTFVNTAIGVRKGSDASTIPMIIGSNAQEGRTFLAAQYGGSTKSAPDITQVLTTVFKTASNNMLSTMDSQIRNAYAYGVGKEYATDFDAASAILTDVAFTCPTSLAANLSAASGAPTWR
jgi:carboxylesterase type B